MNAAINQEGSASSRTGEDRCRPRVLFTCGREPSYTRNRMVLEGLLQYADVTTVVSDSNGYLLRHLSILFRLLFARRDFDVIFVGFYGYLLVFVARLLFHTPIVFDAYISTYDTVCFDRRSARPDSIPGRATYWIDRLACQIANLVVVDTKEHARYFADTYNVPTAKLRVLYLGYDSTLFSPRSGRPERDHFRVFYYGSFLPVHGVEYVVRAAALLAHRADISFEIAGGGPGLLGARQLAQSLGCTNVHFTGWIQYSQLPDHIGQSSICLGGHFSDRAKASRVIATKTFQFLAMAKPTIVGRCPANAELFVDRKHVLCCNMGDSVALARAVCELYEDQQLREQIATNGRALVSELFAPAKVASQISAIVAQARNR